MRLFIPKETWEPIYFRSINERTSEANVPSLRTMVLPEGDFEIRVWVGFGLYGIDGLVLRRSSDRWSALHLHGMIERPPHGKYERELGPPKSGWPNAWQRLEEAGVLTLPDASSINCDSGINDGKSYVVEVNKDSVYRTYQYDNPDYAKCAEAKQMIKIGEVIAEEFGLEEFKSGK
ncbi:MAG: hypothetical protein LC800_07920 [Acidobacteria bacterium]|nr:hypothetical protein [Acidobacteriota bacterium]